MVLYRVFAYIKDSTEKKFSTSAAYEMGADVDADEMLANVCGTYTTVSKRES